MFDSAVIVVLLIVVVSKELTPAFCDDPQKTLAFVSEVWDSEKWSVRTSLPRGSTARLRCTTGITDGSAPALGIKKSTETDYLSYNDTSGQVIHLFRDTDCDIMGTYVCESQGDMRKRTNVAILECDPRLCNSNDRERVILSAAVGERCNFSLCITVFPDVPKVELVESLNKKRISNESIHWTWNATRTAFSTYAVTVTFEHVRKDDPGNYTFGIVNSYEGNQRQLNYSVELKLEEPPDCPRDIEVTNRGTEYITLSWQPGSHGGAEQCFGVYISEDNVTWTAYPTKIVGTSFTIAGLKAGSTYAFSSVSCKKFTQYKDETLCNNTVYYQTAIQPASPTDSLYEKNHQMPDCTINVVTLVLVVLLVMAAMAGAGVYLYKRSSCSDNNNNKDTEVRRADPAQEMMLKQVSAPSEVVADSLDNNITAVL